MTKTRRGLFGALKGAWDDASETKAPAVERDDGSPEAPPVKTRAERTAPGFGDGLDQPFIGLRDLKPRTADDADWMAMPAERALSAEMKRVGESAPPWVKEPPKPPGGGDGP